MAKSKPGQSMTLRVTHIREEGEPYYVELEEPELSAVLAEVGDYRTAGRPLQAHLHLARFDDNVTVKGTLETHVAYTCSRCLAEVTEALQVTLSWRFLPAAPYRAAAAPDEEVELTAEDMDVSFYDGDQIDLSDILREALLLELEPYPACAGGCSEEPVVAEPPGGGEAVDPRWLPLLELKRRTRS
jgi:uncharacterized protein